METAIYEEKLKNKHSQNMAVLFNAFDIQAIPEDFIKILDEGLIEFVYISRRSNIIGRAAEICIIFPKVKKYWKIYVLYDYGYCMKYEEKPVREFMTSEGRNEEIVRLYKEGLTQVFIGHFFKLSQPSISLIVKKGRENNNE